MREHSNQDQIRCENMGESMFFASIVGSEYYAAAPRNTVEVHLFFQSTDIPQPQR